MSGTQAYVDESERSGRYLMCSVVIDPARAGQLRRQVKGLLLPGQRRLHFKKEGNRRRRDLASALVGLDLDASVFVCRAALGRGEAEARALCLAAIVQDLQTIGEPVSLVLESRHHQDEDDQPIIAAARRRQPSLSYEHVDGDHDPLLWLPDSFAWIFGAGPDWRRRIAPAIRQIVDVGEKPQTQLPTVRTSTGFTSSGPGPPAPTVCHRLPAIATLYRWPESQDPRRPEARTDDAGLLTPVDANEPGADLLVPSCGRLGWLRSWSLSAGEVAMGSSKRTFEAIVFETVTDPAERAVLRIHRSSRRWSSCRCGCCPTPDRRVRRGS